VRARKRKRVLVRSSKAIDILVLSNGVMKREVNTFGTNPLKKLVMPSFFIMLPTILNPLSGFSKFLFWIRVLITSRGAETKREAEAPAIEATKFWSHVALL
jgi:hypothetical protein